MDKVIIYQYLSPKNFPMQLAPYARHGTGISNKKYKNKIKNKTSQFIFI